MSVRWPSIQGPSIMSPPQSPASVMTRIPSTMILVPGGASGSVRATEYRTFSGSRIRQCATCTVKEGHHESRLGGNQTVLARTPEVIRRGQDQHDLVGLIHGLRHEERATPERRR